MNEEVLNIQVRKFLKKVGIQSQREIEQAVKDQIKKYGKSWVLIKLAE